MNLRKLTEGRKLDEPSVLLGAAAGLCGGTLLGYFLSRRAFVRKLDAEVAAVQDHYNARAKAFLEAGTPFVGPVRLAPHSFGPDHAGDGDPGTEAEAGRPAPALRRLYSAVNEELGYSPAANLGSGTDDGPGPDDGEGDDYEGDDGLDPNEDGDFPPDDVPQPQLLIRDFTKPYRISHAEVADMPPGWTTSTVTWYSGDNVLTDSQDRPVRDILRTTGPLSEEMFGGISGDPHICYIQNHALELIFEVILDKRKYLDAVLGDWDKANGR